MAASLRPGQHIGLRDRRPSTLPLGYWQRTARRFTEEITDMKEGATMGKQGKLSNYERRERMKKAAEAKPHERPPAGVKLWRKWSLAEVHRQGQQEMFPRRRSENPDVVAAKQRRRKRRMGVWG
jgi:hypothetical protein